MTADLTPLERAASRHRWSRLPRGRCSAGRPHLNDSIDEAKLWRATGGERLRLNSREMAAAVERLDGQGMSALLIAERLGCTTRTVHRHRAAVRAVS